MKSLFITASLLFISFLNAQSFDYSKIDELIKKQDEQAAKYRNLPSAENFQTTVFNTINHARVDPKGFIEVYKKELEEKYPNLLHYLKLANPVDSLKWDSGAYEMAKKRAQGDPKPDEAFTYPNCGSLGGGSLNNPPIRDPLYYLDDDFTVINDPGYINYGVYFSSNIQECYHYYTVSCNQKKYSIEPTEIDTSKVDVKKLNTAIKEKYLSDKEKRMIYEINFVRQYPKEYAQIVQNYIAKEGGVNYDMYIAALDLIDQLKTDEVKPLLEPEGCIYDVAKAHALDCEQRGKWAHEGSDRSHPYQRIPKCNKISKGNENLVAGWESPREATILLLLDFGISSRGHRHNMLNSEWNSVGVYHYVSDKFLTKYQYVQNFGMK